MIAAGVSNLRRRSFRGLVVDDSVESKMLRRSLEPLVFHLDLGDVFDPLMRQHQPPLEMITSGP